MAAEPSGRFLMSIRITCINKSGGYHADPHHAILDLNWTNEQTGDTGRSTRLQVYDWIKNQKGVAFVRDDYDNLLALPECR
jgi:hypothetical protein